VLLAALPLTARLAQGLPAEWPPALAAVCLFCGLR
jgi:hypothetical protein